MATKYHLRPIAHVHTGEPPLSPSTTASTGSDRSPTSGPSKRAFLPPAPPGPSRQYRPISPTLRELELSPVDADAAPMPRRGGFPAPPTGHELMALFPPPPPNAVIGPTSGFFFEQERAFFARKGNEIVTVQIEVDMHAHAHPAHAHVPVSVGEHPARHASRSPRGHALAPPPPGPSPPIQGGPRGPRGGIPIIPVPAQSASAPSPYPPHAHSVPPPQPHPHARTTPPQAPMDVQMQYPMHPPAPPPPAGEHGGKQQQQGEGYPVEDDEAWRRPMPHNERRRAGKHTKRVIVVK
ncbi:uncharacterized protein C8Q71DRAFT_856935 [Rhodofomes roseus]|uniref:Uncharacterized protein n=1 Tax=Rhodofomes roseus TaxID=34475 RepID=A0ABQ8KIQ0_9APHY|nr:uncharacterized protein C8Q71DRAFT_856935 [Rhodofomes roseus]KAH9837746.1 hypothetical protein C8Q71DRAFT_856935 [Rhodofomes roseus]